MKKKVLHIAFLAIVLLLCVTLCVGMLFTGPSEAGANETLSEFPQFKSKDGKINTEYLSQLAAWVDDHFFLRQELISLDHLLGGKLFSVSGDSGVILGADGWLYYSDTLGDYTGTNRMSERELFAAANNLSLMSQYCRDNGRKFVFVIAPNKNSLYGENMPNYGQRAEQTNADRLLERLDTLGVETVDLFEAFDQEEQILYFAHDSHWNSRGAALGADLINAVFGVESRFYEAEFSQTVPHTGDLYQMLYPAFTDPEQDHTCSDLLSYGFTTSATRPDAIVLNTESDGAGTLLAYRDSFGNLLFPYLAHTYRTARFSRSSSYDLTYDGEFVLIELVERNLHYLTENLPVMPAPQVQIPLPEETAGVISVASTKRGERVQLKGELPETDDDSRIYVVCADAVYEAFCLDTAGFGLTLDATCTPEYVLCKTDGAYVTYRIEIQD